MAAAHRGKGGLVLGDPISYRPPDNARSYPQYSTLAVKIRVLWPTGGGEVLRESCLYKTGKQN